MVFAWSGKADVIAHGAVTTFFGGHLHLSVPTEPPTRVEFWFQTDSQIEGPRARADWSEVGALITCVNFDDDAGRGTSRPLYLKDDGDHVLFLHFRVFRHGLSDDRTLMYSFFRARRDELPHEALHWESA